MRFSKSFKKLWHPSPPPAPTPPHCRRHDAKRKYFEHAGALLTADGTDDDLIKLEGVPPGYKLVIPSYGY